KGSFGTFGTSWIAKRLPLSRYLGFKHAVLFASSRRWRWKLASLTPHSLKAACCHSPADKPSGGSNARISSASKLFSAFTTSFLTQYSFWPLARLHCLSAFSAFTTRTRHSHSPFLMLVSIAFRRSPRSPHRLSNQFQSTITRLLQFMGAFLPRPHF